MKIKPCPFCGSEDLSVLEWSNKSYLRCEKCYVYGPDGKDNEEAIERWNAAPRKEDAEMEQNCGSCKYNLDGYCGAVPSYKSFKVHDQLCCTDWEEKDPESAPLNSSNSRGLYDGRNDCDYPNLSGGCHVFPAGKPFIDGAGEALDVIRTLETKVNEYQMAAEEAAELAQALLKLCRVEGHGSYTPLNPKDAMDAVIEEYADLLLAMEASFPRCEGNRMFYNKLVYVYRMKAERWAERLKEAKEE